MTRSIVFMPEQSGEGNTLSGFGRQADGDTHRRVRIHRRRRAHRSPVRYRHMGRTAAGAVAI